MKALLRDYALAVGWYVTFIAVGLVVTLTVSSAVGYLPYSDRPGPGWIGPSFSFGQLGFYASWGVLLLIPTALYGSVLFAYHRLLRWLDAPLLLVRLIAAVSAGVIAFVLAAGVGWYIAIAAFPVWIAAGLGVVWGAVLLPRYLGRAGPHRTPKVQWAAIAVLLLAGPLELYRVFFMPNYGQNLQLNVVRVTHEDKAPPTQDRLPNLEPQEIALLDSLFPHARVERGMTGSSSSGADDHTARMLIVLTGPLPTEARLRVPKGTSAAYVQEGDTWHLYPPNAPTLTDRVRLATGARPSEMTFAWPGTRPSPFTWREN